MGYGIPNCRADGSGRKHRVGRETLAPERTEMPQVRGGQTTRAGVAADRPEPVEGVPLPVRSDLQSVYRHGVGPAPSDVGAGDGLFGAIIVALMEGQPFEIALRRGVA